MKTLQRGSATARRAVLRRRRWRPFGQKVTAYSRSLASTSPKVLAKREDELLDILKKTLDPNIASVKSVRVKSETDISCTIELESGLYPNREELRTEVADAIGGGDSVRVSVQNPRVPTYPPLVGVWSQEQIEKVPEALRRVGSVVAVSSCKGGVGKSTVSVNLAYALAKRGARVGIFDADIYGPSLPTLVNVSKDALPLVRETDTKLLRPPEVGGVKLMSYGFVAKGATKGTPAGAVVRGPIVSQMIQQLALGTKWDELDVLVVDLPPGTGDIVLTACQTLAVTAAVVVTTPQQLSYVDVVKGVDMFRELKVPIASVVENMSHFDAKGERFYPFGRGLRDRLTAEKGLENVSSFSLPIRETLSTSVGTPLSISGEDEDVTKTFDDVAEHLSQWIVRRQIEQRKNQHKGAVLDAVSGHRRVQIENGDGSVSTASLAYDTKRDAVVLRILQGQKEGTEHVAPSIDLRLASRDARTASDTTLSRESFPKTLHPTALDVVGNYAVSISWSDGHEDGIYPFSLIVDVASRNGGGAVGTAEPDNEGTA
eukprot:g640.t1